jgi:hypothetical protein
MKMLISRNQKTKLNIRDKVGKISDSDNHGHDPCPSNG